jgi:hypothetical protein
MSENRNDLPEQGKVNAQEPPPPPPDNRTASYFEKLIKYIPGELVAAYLALDGILREELMGDPISMWLYWGVFIALLVLTPLYVKYRPSQEAKEQSIRYHCCAATVAFAVWVFALGGPFAVTWPSIYRPVYGSLLLIVTTLIIPVIEVAAMKLKFFKPDSNSNQGN